MARLCFDYGHGGTDPGAVYNGRKEADDVLSLGRSVAEIVRHHGIIVDETRTADVTVSLTQRCDFENKGTYDYFISFHRNAFRPEQARGVETYTYLNPGAKSKGLAEKIQTALVDIGFVNRGVKTANFQVLRNTRAPAVLIEIGFIDNSRDNDLFDSKRVEIAQAIAGAILSQLGIENSEYQKPREDETMTQDRFNSMMDNWQNQYNPLYARLDDVPDYWREEAEALAASGIITGDGINPFGLRRETLKALIIGKRYVDRVMKSSLLP